MHLEHSGMAILKPVRNKSFGNSGFNNLVGEGLNEQSGFSSAGLVAHQRQMHIP